MSSLNAPGVTNWDYWDGGESPTKLCASGLKRWLGWRRNVGWVEAERWTV